MSTFIYWFSIILVMLVIFGVIRLILFYKSTKRDTKKEKTMVADFMYSTYLRMVKGSKCPPGALIEVAVFKNYVMFGDFRLNANQIKEIYLENEQSVIKKERDSADAAPFLQGIGSLIKDLGDANISKPLKSKNLLIVVYDTDQGLVLRQNVLDDSSKKIAALTNAIKQIITDQSE